MKKIFSMILAMALSLPFFVSAQVYQLPNPGFEQWDNNYASSDDEPTSWNGFPDADCTVSVGCSAATQTRHERSTDVRPGSTGSYSCKIFATRVSILFVQVTANGNITTGRIHVGSITATDASNHNVSQRAEGFAQPFNAKPDSIVFWAKFSCPDATQKARMTAYIHDDYDFHDPMYAADEPHIVGKAQRAFTQTDGQWQRFSVPFVYDIYTATTPEYILLTFTTNEVQGAGSANDFVWIDDIEIIYNATLSDLRSGDATVPAFSASTYHYDILLPHDAELPVVSATTFSPNAEATITQPTTENPTATIVVTHGDQTQTYTISYTFAEPELVSADLSDLRVDDVTIEGFDPEITAYTVEIMTADEVVYPTVSATALADNATIEIEQATADNNGTATVTVTCGDLTKVYTVTFNVVEINTALADLKVDGVTIQGFDPEVLAYTYILPAGAITMPYVAATAASQFAEVAVNQATADDSTATVAVTMADAATTYSVTFVMPNSIRNAETEAFQVYPNPTNDKVTFVLAENSQATHVAVYNMAGQMVKNEGVTSSNVTLSVRDLQRGLYIVMLRNGSTVLGITKLVKE